jgi:hypothetical protein
MYRAATVRERTVWTPLFAFQKGIKMVLFLVAPVKSVRSLTVAALNSFDILTRTSDCTPGMEHSCISFRIIFIAFFCLLISVPVWAAGEYRTWQAESLRITVDSEWCNYCAPGYWPVRLDITNLGNDRVIEFSGFGSRWWSSGGGIMWGGGEPVTFEIRQLIRLKRSDHVKLTIPVPVSGSSEDFNFQIQEKGRILQHFYAGGGMQSNLQPAQVGALIVAAPATPFFTLASGLLRPIATAPPPPSYPGATPPPPMSVPKKDFILEPLRLPSNWLGLTSLRAVLISPKEWEKLESPQKEALLAWTASGGEFIFVDGDLSTLLPDLQARPVNLNLKDGQRQHYYFGRIHLVKSEDLKANGLAFALSKLAAKAENSDIALPVNLFEWLKASENGFRLPIPGIGGVPVRTYLLILVAFSVLIGPLNFLWLWKKRRQILLVLTTPLISAAFILLLSGYALLGEGLGVTGRVESFTLLDQKTNRAATRATVSMYAAGMAPGNGLQFSRNAAVYHDFAYGGHGKQDRQVLDLTELQQFSNGFIRARAPSNFEEISFRPARERLNFSRADNGVTVVNGLGATITGLVYRDAGKLFKLDLPLKAGEKGLLHSADESSLNVLPEKIHRLQETQADHAYIAWLESSPFIETGVPSLKERGSHHFILGYVGE